MFELKDKYLARWNRPLSTDPTQPRYYYDDCRSARFRSFEERDNIVGVKDMSTNRLLIRTNADDYFRNQIEGLAREMAKLVRGERETLPARPRSRRHQIVIEPSPNRVDTSISLFDVDRKRHGEHGHLIGWIDVDPLDAEAIAAAAEFLQAIALHLNANPLDWTAIRRREPEAVFYLN